MRQGTKKKGSEEMNERLRNNELVITLSNINNLINNLEDEIRHLKATDKINQLLYAYDIKTKILHEMR